MEGAVEAAAPAPGGQAPPQDWEQAAAQLEGLDIGRAGGEGSDGAPAEQAAGSPRDGNSRAIDAAAAAHVDHALKDALAHPKNRASVLRLEAEVEAFVLKSEEPQHVFSGDMSSYERLLAHRTAQHWGLETSTVNHGPDQGRIMAIRTHGTHQPEIKLADVPVTVQEGQQGSGGAPAGSPPAPRVLVRKRSDRMGHRGGPMMGPGGMEGPYGMASGINGQYRSVQEREAEYHRARARIFGDAGGPEGYGPVMGSPGGVPPPPPGRGGPLNGGVGHGGPGGGGMMAGGMPTPFGGMMGHMAPQQMGGAGMYGGASGMGRPGMPGPGGMSPYGAPPSSPYGAAAGGHVAPYGASPGAYSAGPAGGYGGGYGGGGGGGGPRPTKAQLRNKEADMADPDFRRGRGLHGPRFDPGFGEEAQQGVSAYVRPTYGSEFPELSGSGSGGSGSMEGGPRGGPRGGGGDHRPAASPRSNGGGGGMLGPGMAATAIPGSPAAAAMYAGYGGQMGASGMTPQEMMAMQYSAYGQGMMPAGAMMAPMQGMVYPGTAGGGMPYGMVAMQPYAYMPMRPGQQEAMMAYAAGMQLAYGAPYGSPAGAGGMGMPLSPVSGMQNPLSPGGGGQLGRRTSGGGRYSGGRGGRGGSSQTTPRADSMGQDRQYMLQQQAPAVAAAAAVAAAQQAQQAGPPPPQQQQQQQAQQQQAASQQAALPQQVPLAQGEQASQ